jgi:sulfoxide reductase catalytic subunit YedY
MRIHLPKTWELPESAATPEGEYRGRSRRDFLKTLGAGAAGAFVGRPRLAAALAGLPAVPNPSFAGADLKVTSYQLITGYNNFYEFGQDKGDPRIYANEGWKSEPWSVEIAGPLAGNPGKWDVEALVKKLGGVEQRVYRHRCVEAWSMVIPWDGFALAKLVKFADPKPGAHFIKFTSFLDPGDAPGQRDGDYWPYVEGLHLAEARNELAFIATGIYGKPLLNQNGAPWRLVVPWKYGFKGIKSIVRIEFTERQPTNTWSYISPDEYGFFANVNPNHDHPRWSQASEKIIDGSFFGHRQPTLMFNGYEKEVAHLYQGLDLDKYF